jgi:hypothetical protein
MPRTGQHLFVLLEDFETHIWSARILNSAMNGKSLAQYLSGRLEKPFRPLIEQPIEPPIERCTVGDRRSIISPLLNFSLSIERLKAYAKSGPRPNC